MIYSNYYEIFKKIVINFNTNNRPCIIILAVLKFTFQSNFMATINLDNLNDDIRNGNYEIIKLSKQRQTAYNF